MLSKDSIEYFAIWKYSARQGLIKLKCCIFEKHCSQPRTILLEGHWWKDLAFGDAVVWLRLSDIFISFSKKYFIFKSQIYIFFFSLNKVYRKSYRLVLSVVEPCDYVGLEVD